jgi:hypothetical protein
MHPTNRERQTGGVDPFSVAAAQDFGALMQDAEIIDSAPGDAGAVTVRHTPGRAPQPFDPLTGDPSAVARYAEPRGVTVEVRHGRRP